MESPRLIRAFLSPTELAALPRPKRWYASVVETDAGVCEDTYRTSRQCQLSRAVARTLEAALRRAGTTAASFEEGSWVRYDVGQSFGVHGDASGLDDGRRRYTLLVGIKAARRGGETHFPYLADATYKLAPGDALLWCNYDADGRESSRMDHEARAVEAGRKVVINAWFSCDKKKIRV